MAPQPTKALAAILLAACARTTVPNGFAALPEQSEAERSCQAGSAKACGALGRMLLDLGHTHGDEARALVLLEIACGRDDLPACTTLAAVYLRRSDDVRARGRARDLASQACDGRSGEACTELGVIMKQELASDPKLAWAAYRKGCELGDVRGCELFALAASKSGSRDDRIAADAALARACQMGRLSTCHTLGLAHLEQPDTQQEAAALLARNCDRGFGPSCEALAFWTAPLVSASPDCARALPAADKACQLNQTSGCAVAAACRLADPRTADPAAEHLREACERNEPIACLYWADAESRRAEPAPEIGRIVAAYRVACRGGPRAAPIACPRFAAASLAAAKTVGTAEAALAQLRHQCDRSMGEACCELGAQYRSGKWVPADEEKAGELSGKACGLGCKRCCR